ncbi:tubulin polyglutamylase TTLL4 isoform X2 [Phycodurus eques]|uniref:tubulin polyglutamylase TTLL4 isoform X2 n=1 Tax=Phycodurus eques TaxID=693459 RepID=UPI002ACE0423|nr:tubulin polyglutamylase TTLL4 isoform X2 [Phycodurus eques]XP_061548413.1 tubulin polyglutamylase TTLL4 isoform X2 [Phycodurus eques]
MPLAVSVSIDPKTVATVQVPFSNQERTKLPASSSAQEQANLTKSQSAAMPRQPPKFNGIPSAIKSAGAKPVCSSAMDTGDHSASALKREILSGDNLQPVQGPPSMQMNKSELETAKLSLTPSVPPVCLAPFELQGAKMREDASSLDAKVEMSKSLLVPNTNQRNAAAKFCQTQHGHVKSAAVNNPLQVIGVCPLLVRGKLQTATALDANKFPQSVLDRNGTVCGKLNGHMPNGLNVIATQKEKLGLTKTLPGALMGSVTTKISAIHLTKHAQAACVPSMCLSSTPSQSEASDDGSEYVMQVDNNVEEELPYELENACSDDDFSESSSVSVTSSAQSLLRLSGVKEPMSLEVEDNQGNKPALIPSLFPLISPTLYFSTANEQVEMLPDEQMQLLKWKISSVTPNVVKNAITRSHFIHTKKSNDWLGCWGHHMKSSCFRTLQEHQKLNHFPGTFQIGRKDRLWKNLSKMACRFGKHEFNFFPRTFVLPQDILQLRKAWKDGSRQKWIIKPPASARGTGIQVIHKWSQMPRKKSFLVQKYLHKPYLISGNKFDLRIYVYVTCYDPLRIYIFSDGLVRFASCKYSSSMKTLSNKFMHLTNYSVNKKNSEYQANSDDKACQGHKWTVKALWQYLGSRGVNTILIWEKIKDIVIKTIIASEPYVNSLLKMHVRTPYSCHELFGFDIMLDENLKPWILEVNISPSLHSNTALDVSVKGQMVRDLLNLAGFRIPQREDVVISSGSTSSSSSSVSKESPNLEVSVDEKVKRAFYLKQRFADQGILATVLDVLTPNDVRMLVESEDELSRRGEFERIFPSQSSSRYLRFFQCPRYLSIVLDQWERKYWNNRTKGVILLRPLCQKGVHLGTTDPAHMWSKCSYISKFEHHREAPVNPSKSRVVVIHQHQSDHMELDEGSDGDTFVPSSPTLQSPASSADSSACASPQPSL